MKLRLLLIGCGNLGKALLKAWGKTNIFEKIIVVQPSLKAKTLFQSPTVSFIANGNEIINFIPDIMVIAVKPQQIHAILPDYRKYAGNAVTISFAAGVTLPRLGNYLESNKKIVRLMPNIAMQIGKSVNLICSSPDLAGYEQQMVEKLFSNTGKMIWLEKEELIDLLTPVAGSGPAYFFLLAEILTEITIKSGLTENIARELVQQVFIGSALLTDTDNDFKRMINSVASKGGVTEAALQLLSPALADLFEDAFIAALKKLNELKNEDRY